MNILLTGATGFVGSHVLAALNTFPGVETYVLIRNLAKLNVLEGKRFHTLRGDLFTVPSLPRNLDCVIHVAGLTKARKIADYYTVNQYGTASLFQALEAQDILPGKFILLSSLAAVGPSTGGHPITEDISPQPITHYGKSKLLGEQEALRHGDNFPVAIVRVGAVYGPGDTDFLNYFKWIKKGILPRFGRRKRLFSFCHGADLAKGLGLISQKELKKGEIFNIAHPTPHLWDDLGTAAASHLGVKPFPVTLPLALVYAAALFSEIGGKLTGRPSIVNREKFRDLKQDGWVVDTAKAQSQLGFVPDYPLERGVAQTINWYQEQGLL
jgi:dihydroflavonol-4-reductase